MLDTIIPDWPAPSRVRTLVTTRAWGNLATHVGDAPAHVAANRAILRQSLPAEPIWLDQVHGVRCIAAAPAATGGAADAAWTDRRETVCAILSADCLPVLLCDRGGTVVAAAHAGWRGLAAGVIEATVAALARPPGELLAWLGPAIGPAGFEVGAEVRDVFVRADPAASEAFTGNRAGRWQADLFLLARQRLVRAGVNAIHGGKLCTWSNPQRFYSFRRDQHTGRQASLIWLV